MRISLYPIVMVVLNLVITIADIRISTASGIYSQGDYSLYVVYYALYGARGIFYAMIAIIDPSILRGIRVWRGLHSAAMSSVSDDNYDFTVGGGIISVQAEITRLAEELGIYDAERKSGASSPLAPLTPAVTRPGQFSVPARRIETNIEGGSDPESPPPQQEQQQRQEEDQDERLPEGGGRKSSSAEAAEEDRVVEEVRRRRKQDRSARLEAEKLVKRQI
jgi:hypothetical protein